MFKSNIKRNLILFVTLVMALASVVVAFLIAPSAKAEGNNSGADGAANLIKITMDVNGIDANGNALDGVTNARDDSPTKVDTNNLLHYRRRYFYIAVAGKVLSSVNVDNFFYDGNTIVNGSGCVNVGIEEGMNNQSIYVEAIKLTNASTPAYFSVGITDGNEKYTINFEVTVEDTFAMLGDPTNGGITDQHSTKSQLYVGYRTNENGEYDVPNHNAVSYKGEGEHDSILTVPNYSTLSVNLNDYLVGRALYYESKTLDDGNYSTAIREPNTKIWTIKSAYNFKINSAAFVNLGGVIKDPIYSQSTSTVRISPVFTARIEVSNETIRDFKGNFWDSIHLLQLSISQVSGTSSAKTIYIPVRFTAYNPQVKEINSSYMRLNVTSQNTFDFDKRAYLNADGAAVNDQYDYSAILIRPTDLIEYSFPDSYGKMTFLWSGTYLNGSHEDLTVPGMTVTREPDDVTNDERYPEVIRILGTTGASVANSNFTVTLTVVYYTSATSYDQIAVNVSVETYGGYIVNFAPINGKKSVGYNVLNANVFAEMRERGYLLTEATSNNIDQLGVDLSNNVLTLTPNVDKIDGQTTATIALTFTNNSNQKLTFDSGVVNINVNAGSLFARFEDWQAWLIIAACILAGIIVILLIVWLFIHSISKHRQEELATQAPVSSYIVKLNSTIAATQAQQRAAQTQALSQASAQMLLGAGPAGTAAPPPDTLALASGAMSQPGSMPGATSEPKASEPGSSAPGTDSGEDLNALIAKYITDEELLERIFVEKYEPKGMIRRTFFKSKDLQTRELEKEKKRIIDRYNSPMPMDEAIMSEAEIARGATSSSPATSTPEETGPSYAEMFVLSFNPDDPLYVEPEKASDEFADEKIDLDVSPEEARVRELEHRDDILAKELEELKRRLDNLQSELGKAKSIEDELREKIAKAESDDEQYGKDIEQLEFSLATAKNKDKERITRDIGIKEEKKKRNLDDLDKLRKELEALLGSSEKLVSINTNYTDIQTQKITEREALAGDLTKARAELDAYLERLRKVQARQELESKINSLTPLLQEVNHTDYELRAMDNGEQKLNKERETLKDAVAAAKAQIMGATDFGIISDLNTEISDANSRLSDIEREITLSTKKRSQLNIEFNAQRRKANEFCEKNDIPLEEIIKAEDLVIGNIELDIHKSLREKDKEDAEMAVAAAQAVYDDLSVSANDVTLIAMDVAAGIKDIEDEIETLQAELDAVNAQMETASDDEQLILMVEQGDKSDKIEELKAQLEQANIEGTKRKMEAQAEHDEKLEAARVKLGEAQEEFERASGAYDDLVNNTNPLDLIISGSGVISQDQKKIEAENLKKQLERSKNEIEQARLAAQMAQEQAEQARLEAERAAEEARLEAERAAEEARQEAERAAEEAARNAQEEIEKEKQARLEAEEKARKDVEEAERAKRELEESVAAEQEEAKRKAQEEAEEAQRRAQEEAEEAQRKAQEEAEEAQRRAQEEAEEAKRKAQEENDEAMRRVQEEAEEAQRRAQEEAEEAKRKAQEEIDEMRRKAEEEAEAKRLEEENKRKEEEERLKAEQEKADMIAKKVAMRKDQIIAIRNEMKDLKGDEDAKNLRERLYNIQLTYDEDEKGSSELMDFYNKTMDDITSAGEIARLKAENAKKPQRVVRKVTERVNRIAKKKPAQRSRNGARPGSRSGARPASRAGARPASRAGARPASRAGARPAARPGARPATRPSQRPNRPR
ncbi:MAG: hypothetical protein HDT28_06030 [Clostridiales bacterium]|nr:hypothetical protein [Clostridiales bacterium]